MQKNKSAEVKEYLYVLDDGSDLHCLEIGDELTEDTTIDFSGHSLDQIIDDDWSRCHLSHKAVTYN